jgi:hypothetical protein
MAPTLTPARAAPTRYRAISETPRTRSRATVEAVAEDYYRGRASPRNEERRRAGQVRGRERRGLAASRERDAYAACDALSRSFRGWPTARIREVEQCYVDLLRAVPGVDGRDVPSLECLPSRARFSAPVSAAAGTVASIALRRRECGPADSDSGRDGGSKRPASDLNPTESDCLEAASLWRRAMEREPPPGLAEGGCLAHEKEFLSCDPFLAVECSSSE